MNQDRYDSCVGAIPSEVPMIWLDTKAILAKAHCVQRKPFPYGTWYNAIKKAFTYGNLLY